MNVIKKKAAIDYALWLLSRKSYGSWEIENKLQLKQYSRQEILDTMSKLEKLGLFNDLAYIRYKISGKLRTGNKSLKMITYELKYKGFPPDLISKIVQENEIQNLTNNSLIIAIQKKLDKLNNKNLQKNEIKNKLISHLLSKGFSYNEICSQFTKSNDTKR